MNQEPQEIAQPQQEPQADATRRGRAGSSSGKKLLRVLGSLITFIGIVAMGAVGYAVYEAYGFLTTPPQDPGKEIVVVIEPGTPFSDVADQLHAKNLIANPYYFRLLGRYRKAAGSIRAGEFQLHTGWTPDTVLDALVSGPQVLHRLSLREGLTMRETAQAVEKAGYASAASVLQAAKDLELLQKYNVPFTNAEGFLFPETYFLEKSRAMDGRYIVELLLQHFWDQTAGLWPENGPSDELLKRTVILASIVEKETGAAAERRKVAGVFANRLERGMLLQSDPTVIYGLGDAFDGNLKRSHLEERSNTYNTYTRAGLPPGPICSPGLASIQAVLQPEEHTYLYFVSKNDGAHYFSKSLKEHNRAVNKYQRRK